MNLKELDMLRQTDIPEIKKAVTVIHKMSADEKMRELAYMREKALHDEATALGHARREGKAERDMELTPRLKALGLTDEQIAKIFNDSKNPRSKE